MKTDRSFTYTGPLCGFILCLIHPYDIGVVLYLLSDILSSILSATHFPGGMTPVAGAGADVACDALPRAGAASAGSSRK